MGRPKRLYPVSYTHLFDDAKKTIADNVATLQAGIADKQDAIWKAELERQLLDYNQSPVSYTHLVPC